MTRPTGKLRARAAGTAGKVVTLGSGSAGQPNTNVLVGVRSDFPADQVSPALLALSERQFQALVRAELERQGFTVWAFPNMRLTTAGVLDLTFWHPKLPGRLFCWELKRERDYRVTPAQRQALMHLASVSGVDARIVRPSQWEALRDDLIAQLMEV